MKNKIINEVYVYRDIFLLILVLILNKWVILYRVYIIIRLMNVLLELFLLIFIMILYIRDKES